VKKRRTEPKDLLARQSQPVPMPVAASLVYHQLNHNIADAALQDGYAAALNSTALALSQVSDVYYIEQGKLLRIPNEELALGSFEDRGDTYRAASGKIYRSLSMRRIDVMQAMTILRKARSAIDGAKLKARNQT
jgi:hypothetical protein